MAAHQVTNTSVAFCEIIPRFGFTSWSFNSQVKKEMCIVPSEGWSLYFLSDDHLFKGFHGKAELSNETFHELDDHHHHVDAAFLMHYEDEPTEHQRMFLFLVQFSL